MRRLLQFAVACGIVLAGTAGRVEATEYIYTTIDYPGASRTYASGINDSGQIVGKYYFEEGHSNGFTLSGGVYTSFNHPAAASGGSGASDINNSGQIVGWYDTVGSGTLGAYLHDGDEYHALTPFGSARTEAWGINDSANVVGYYRDAADVDRGFLFDGASYTTIDDPDAVNTYAWDINNAGTVLGHYEDAEGALHYFSYEGEYTLIDYPGATTTNVGGINNSGSIVGYALLGQSPPRGFLLEDGTFTPIDVPGFPASNARDINDLGTIVGITGLTPDMRRAFVLAGGDYSILHVPGALETIANQINNLGHVMGSYSDDSGTWHDYLATPIAAADFDRDGDVDSADLALWQGDYGLNANCDADGDGDTDGRDFLVWQRQYTGATMPGLSVSVPEPATVWLVLMALAGSVLAARNTF